MVKGLQTIFNHTPDGGGETGRLQIDPKTGDLYWNDAKIQTENRLARFERGLAIVALIIAGVGALGSAVQGTVALGHALWGWP